MTEHRPDGPSRRAVLAGAGALIVNFSFVPRASAQAAAGETAQQTPSGKPAAAPAPKLPGSLKDEPRLDAWIRIDASGGVSVFTGKAELGQGVRTSLRQVAAEELEVPFEAITFVTADTGRTPNEGFTAGSHSMQDSGTALRNASAQVRDLLIQQAATRWSLPMEQLHAERAAVVAPDGRRLGYGELVAGNLLAVDAKPTSRLKDPKDFTVMGKPIQRVDIPGKVTGGMAYVQDMRPEGMLHGRVVRPPSPGAMLVSLDTKPVEAMPGVVKVVRNGNFLGVLAKGEWQAIQAMRALTSASQWKETPDLPEQARIYDTLRKLPTQDATLVDTRKPVPAGAKRLEATFTRPYQSHGSIGPSCAVGVLQDGVTTVWTHTQGVYPDRDAIAEMLGVGKDKVRCIHTEGSGCYGHNGADDAAADAALLAQAVPGQPVRLQWMREQEHAWEPYGPAMVTHVSAALDASGRIVDWDYELWSNPHGTRPGGAGALLPARHLEKPFQMPRPHVTVTPEGSGDRNAIPLYALPSTRVVNHFLADMPLRVSAMRALGAYANVYSIETFMDELALAAGQDSVSFRLAHLQDKRGCDVITTAADAFGWGKGKAPEGRGYGFAFARYKNLSAWLALATEVEVERESGRARLVRAVAAIDTGQVINPDGVRNQIEGGILQSMSWTLYEGVTYDRTRITSVDWSTYPILRFGGVPDSVEVHIVDRPNAPFVGSGEAAVGPTSASVGNAVMNAIGKRLYDLPLTRERIKAAIGV